MSKQDDIAATEAALAAFLSNGGAIQQIPTGKSGRVEGESFSMWGKKKKAVPEPVVEEEVVEAIEEDDLVIDEDMVDEVEEDEKE